MANDQNRCFFTGHLGRDPEGTAAAPGKKARASFSIAVNRNYTNSEGETKEVATWINCVAFDRVAEFCYQYLKKGQFIVVQGEIQVRKYTGRDGAEKTATEIVVKEITAPGGARPSQDAQPANENRSQGDPGSQPSVSEQSRPKDDTFDSLGKPAITDDDIPFFVDLSGDDTCPINIASSVEEISQAKNFIIIPRWLTDIWVSAKTALALMLIKTIRINTRRNVPTSA